MSMKNCRCNQERENCECHIPNEEKHKGFHQSVKSMMSQFKSKKTKKVLILQEDELSPDAFETFKKAFRKITGCGFITWKSMAEDLTPEDLRGEAFIFRSEDILAETFCDDKQWRVYRLIPEEPKKDYDMVDALNYALYKQSHESFDFGKIVQKARSKGFDIKIQIKQNVTILDIEYQTENLARLTNYDSYRFDRFEEKVLQTIDQISKNR